MQSPYPLKVRIKPPLGLVVGVTHMVSHLWFFSAYITHSRHDLFSLQNTFFIRQHAVFYAP